MRKIASNQKLPSPSLFATLRDWAARQPRPDDYTEWHGAVCEQAHILAGHGPDIEALAYRVAAWVWTNVELYDHSSEAQRRRGIKSGKVRRERTLARDMEIAAAAAASIPHRILAETHGVSRQMVSKIVKRTYPDRLPESTSVTVATEPNLKTKKAAKAEKALSGQNRKASVRLEWQEVRPGRSRQRASRWTARRAPKQ